MFSALYGSQCILQVENMWCSDIDDVNLGVIVDIFIGGIDRGMMRWAMFLCETVALRDTGRPERLNDMVCWCFGPRDNQVCYEPGRDKSAPW
jgi:hypothetical protein